MSLKNSLKSADLHIYEILDVPFQNSLFFVEIQFITKAFLLKFGIYQHRFNVILVFELLTSNNCQIRSSLYHALSNLIFDFDHIILKNNLRPYDIFFFIIKRIQSIVFQFLCFDN